MGDGEAAPQLLLAPSFPQFMQRCRPFEPEPAIAVAVSGGVDSMVLTALLKDWVKAQSGTLVALTVDHGLRAESAADAQQVGEWMRGFGIEHHILTVADAAPHSGVQRWAREQRYGLLAEYCREQGILHLAVGHHADDQRETQAMRAKREGQLLGAAGMSAVRELKDCRIIRPLLAVPKSIIRGHAQVHDMPWIEDASNQSPAYERNRTRMEAPSAVAPIDRPAKERQLAQMITEQCEIYADGTASCTPYSMQASMEDMWILGRLLMVIGRQTTPPRLKEVHQLILRLQSDHRANLRYCDVVCGGDRWLVRPEAAHVPAAVEWHTDGKATLIHWHGFQWRLPESLPKGAYRWGLPHDEDRAHLKRALPHIKPSILQQQMVLCHEGEPVLLPFMRWSAKGYDAVEPPCFMPPRPMMDMPFATMKISTDNADFDSK